MISFNISRTCVMHILRHFWSFTKYIYILLRVGPGPYTCQASTEPHPNSLKTQFEYILWETHPSQFSWSSEFLPFSWQSFTHTDIACGDKSLTINTYEVMGEFWGFTYRVWLRLQPGVISVEIAQLQLLCETWSGFLLRPHHPLPSRGYFVVDVLILV